MASTHLLWRLQMHGLSFQSEILCCFAWRIITPKIYRSNHWVGGGYHFLQKGVPNLQKVSSSKIETPLFRQQKSYDHPITNTPYPLIRLKLYRISLSKQNKHTICGHLWLPTFWSSKVLWPNYFSFQKFMTPNIFGTPRILKK